MVGDFSTLLTASRCGDGDALSQAFGAAYDELRRLARRQLRRLRPGQTLTTTALVNEAFVKLVQGRVGTVDRAHLERSCDSSGQWICTAVCVPR